MSLFCPANNIFVTGLGADDVELLKHHLKKHHSGRKGGSRLLRHSFIIFDGMSS
uniref:Uncharacterized protein n=1 Tax=Kalanchoe fedtschenkoi TaxID=63787 RepID=A0A7N0ZW36_KALFE